jgi:hypothetical protein
VRAIPIDDFLESDGSNPRTYDWARIVSEARAARKASDGGMWRIGQLALMVERRYASGALKRFADEIGESLGTVRRFRWVAGAYSPETRAGFPELSFSHFQAVAGADERVLWLERARRGGWSVDRLVHESRVKDPRTADAQYRRPIETASRQIARLMERADDRALAKAARHGLADALDDLATQVEQLQARVRKAQARAARRPLKVAR